MTLVSDIRGTPGLGRCEWEWPRERNLDFGAVTRCSKTQAYRIGGKCLCTVHAGQAALVVLAEIGNGRIAA